MFEDMTPDEVARFLEAIQRNKKKEALKVARKEAFVSKIKKILKFK